MFAAQALVLLQGLGEDLRGGLETVQALEAEMGHLLVQVRAMPAARQCTLLCFWIAARGHTHTCTHTCRHATQSLSISSPNHLHQMYAFRAALQVKDTVSGATAVPKGNVFPAFDRLGALQLVLVDELRMLVVRQRLYEGIEQTRSKVCTRHTGGA